MSDHTYIRIRSWHILLTWTRSGQALTICGRRISGPTFNTADELPAEKSCESCLRLIAREDDRA